MIKTIFKTLLIACLSGTYAHAQPGCTDPQALNFDPQATENDGSCSYASTIAPPELVAQLPPDLDECSGLAFFADRLWTHLDGGNLDRLFILDTLTGALLQEVTLPGTDNLDWEDLAESDTHLFVGDFGNNQGDRTDLRIFQIKKSNLLAGTVSAEVIQFSFSDQTDFTNGYNAHNYDCEAFFFRDDSLHLFSKNWTDFKTRHYVLPATPGNYVAQLRDSLAVQGQITGADITDDGKAVLLGYNVSTSECFLWLLFDFPGNAVFSGNKRKISLGSALTVSQPEGIAFRNGHDGYICSERYSVLPQKLFKFDIRPWTENPSGTGQPLDEAVFQVSPNPFGDLLSIDFQQVSLGETGVEVLDLNGKILKKSRLTGPQLTLNTADLPSGMYILKIRNKTGVFTKKIIRQ